MITMFGFEFSTENLESLSRRIVSEPVPEGNGPRLLVTANVDHVVQLQKREDFRAAYAYAWIRTVDGFPVYLSARLRGARLIDRVTGSDLFVRVMEQLDPANHRVFFVACTTQAGDRIRLSLLSRGFTDSAICIRVPPFGFESDKDYSHRLAEDIGRHRATHLFWGLGAPKSEVWSHQNRRALGDCYILCVGAGLEFFTGQKRRAPVIFRKLGMEWLWRFGQEPRRLFRRYFVDSWPFLAALVNDLKNGRVSRSL